MAERRESAVSRALSEVSKVDERPSFLCFRVRSQGLAAALFFALLFSILFAAAGVLLAVESGAEADANKLYVALMSDVRAELNPQLYERLLDFIGIDDVRGTEDFVAYDENSQSWSASVSGFFDAVYVSFNVATTIGYGDVAIRTTAGKMICVLIVLIAVPVAVIAYTRIAEAISSTFMQRLLRGNTRFKAVLRKFDVNHNSKLGVDELRNALRELGVPHVTHADASRVIERFDKDGDEQLSVGEFATAVLALGVSVDELARAQLKLRVAVVLLLSYFVVFAVVAAVILDLTVVDGIYFSVITISTVGFGDITPSGNARVLLTIPVFVAIGLVALVIEAWVGVLQRDEAERKGRVSAGGADLAARLGGMEEDEDDK